MTTEQLQHLGRLLTSGEDNAKLARELMIGQGIWEAAALSKCLNEVAPVNHSTFRDIIDLFDGIVFIEAVETIDGMIGDGLYGGIKCDYILRQKWPRIVHYRFRPRPIYRLETAANRTPKMLPAHHNPTAPTTPTQTTAAAPSGTC